MCFCRIFLLFSQERTTHVAKWEGRKGRTISKEYNQLPITTEMVCGSIIYVIRFAVR